MQTIVESLKSQVSGRAEKRAIQFNDYVVKYSAVNRIVNNISNGLISRGVSKGDRVLLVMPNIPHFIFCYYGILQAGATAVPVNFLFNEKELDKLISATSPHAMMIWDRFWGRFNPWRASFKDIFVVGEQIPSDTISVTELTNQAAEDDPAVEISLDDRAVINYTPGVTGLPKGIEFTHRNIAASVEATLRAFQVTSEDTFAGLLPFFHIVSQNSIVNAALTAGATVRIYQKSDPEHVRSAIFEDKVSILGGSSMLYQSLMQQLPEEKASKLKAAFSFGDSIEQDTAERFENTFNIPILTGYFVSEAGGMASINRFRPYYKRETVGLPMDGLAIRIVNEQGEDLRHNETGQVQVSGDMVMTRYWNDDESTQLVLNDGWLSTGDLMQIDDEGFLYFKTRKDDVINKSGFQIFPEKVEQVLLAHPKIAQAAVIGVSDPRKKQEVKACVILAKDETATSEEIIEYCREHMPNYQCPQMIQFYDSFPKSPTGKVLKRVLRES